MRLCASIAAGSFLLLAACQPNAPQPTTTAAQAAYSLQDGDGETLQPDGDPLIPAMPGMDPALKEAYQAAWLLDREKNAWFWKIPKPSRKLLYRCMGDVRLDEVRAQNSLATRTGNPREWIFIDARNRIAGGDVEPYRAKCPEIMAAVSSYLPPSAR